MKTKILVIFPHNNKKLARALRFFSLASWFDNTTTTTTTIGGNRIHRRQKFLLLIKPLLSHLLNSRKSNKRSMWDRIGPAQFLERGVLTSKDNV